ncbi:MAG TPA: hypothetical protein VKF42_05010 [Chitinivibrionales bacterium]|jgi:hypothetical protein|nr:hypothetical protein [Chitinivibrionales bacterium]
MKHTVLTIILTAACACFSQTAQTAQPAPQTATHDSAAFDTIAGDLPLVLTPKKHPYFVAGDIYVPQGKTVVIAAGTVLCFKNFTGLHIQGTLIVKGIKNSPVVFTSEHDKDYNKHSTVDAAPYDWNGIYIHEDAIGTQLSYCAVLYSVDGINSLTRFFKLSPCVFLHNGRASLTIQGAQYQVTEEPYEYSLTQKEAAAPTVNQLKDPLAPTRNTLRYSGAGFAAIGFFAAVVTATQLVSSQRDFSAISSTSKDNLAQGTGAQWEAARNRRNSDEANLIVSGAVTVIGAVGIFWSLKF